jgi:hypothetical protein
LENASRSLCKNDWWENAVVKSLEDRLKALGDFEIPENAAELEAANPQMAGDLGMVKKPEFGPGKLRVDVYDAYLEEYGPYEHIVFRPIGHPVKHWDNHLVTARSLGKQGDLVETDKYVYNVLSWDESKTPLQNKLF